MGKLYDKLASDVRFTEGLKACLNCGSIIQKQAYMGGSIYFCPGCQKES